MRNYYRSIVVEHLKQFSIGCDTKSFVDDNNGDGSRQHANQSDWTWMHTVLCAGKYAWKTICVFTNVSLNTEKQITIEFNASARTSIWDTWKLQAGRHADYCNATGLRRGKTNQFFSVSRLAPDPRAGIGLFLFVLEFALRNSKWRWKYGEFRLIEEQIRFERVWFSGIQNIFFILLCVHFHFWLRLLAVANRLDSWRWFPVSASRNMCNC